MRAEAETANVRARPHREVNETRQYAVQKFAQEVVEAADNLHRGIESLPPPTGAEPAIVAGLREGLESIERNFSATLERNGIKREDPTGAPFDPNMHQAMAEQESDGASAGQRDGTPGHRPGRCTAGCCARRWWWSPRRRPPRSASSAKAEHHRLMQSCRPRTRIPPPPLARPASPPYILCHTDSVGTLAVLRAARVR